MRISDWSSDVCSSDLFESTIVWMDEDEMLPGRPYLLKTGTSMVTATITKPKYEVNVNTIVHEAAETLSLNAIGVCNISLDRDVPFERSEASLAGKEGGRWCRTRWEAVH